MARVKKKNQWFNSHHQRAFVYDTPKNETATAVWYQCRADYNTDTHIVTVTYFTNGLLDIRKAIFQMRRHITKHTNSPKMIVTVENYCDSSKVQCLFLSYYEEPSLDFMLQLEQRIKELTITAPLINEDNNDKPTYVTEYDDTLYR